MASVVLLLLVLIVSFACVRAGAIALELTGLDPEQARFQALSAFTNTGFTTGEAEEITRLPVRRRIVSVLIILGHAGTVTVIATLATSLLERDVGRLGVHIAIIGGALLVFHGLARLRGVTRRPANALRRWMRSRYHLEAPSLDQLLKVDPSFGVVRVRIAEQAGIVDRPLRNLNLKSRKIQVLSILRRDSVITIPEGDDVLQLGDLVTCYGDMTSISDFFAALTARSPGGPPAGDLRRED